jgi:hypothetical protein
MTSPHCRSARRDRLSGSIHDPQLVSTDAPEKPSTKGLALPFCYKGTANSINAVA